jgi:hypothetical protein
MLQRVHAEQTYSKLSILCYLIQEKHCEGKIEFITMVEDVDMGHIPIFVKIFVEIVQTRELD